MVTETRTPSTASNAAEELRAIRLQLQQQPQSELLARPVRTIALGVMLGGAVVAFLSFAAGVFLEGLASVFG